MSSILITELYPADPAVEPRQVRITFDINHTALPPERRLTYIYSICCSRYMDRDIQFAFSQSEHFRDLSRQFDRIDFEVGTALRQGDSYM